MSATEAEYIDALEAGMEAVWIRKFISELGIVPTINEPIKIFCDNSAALYFAYEPGVQKGAKHYHRRYHYVRKYIKLGEIKLLKVHTDNNLAYPFTNALSKRKLTQHAKSMGLPSRQSPFGEPLDEEISKGGIPWVIVLGYDGFLIQPVASPSPDYIPGTEDPQTPACSFRTRMWSSLFLLDSTFTAESPDSRLLMSVPKRMSSGVTRMMRQWMAPDTRSGIGYRFVSTVDAEERRQGIRDVGYDIRDTWRQYGIVEEEALCLREAWGSLDRLRSAMLKLRRVRRRTDRRRQAQMVETLRVMRDMRREMSDMQAELLALREQQRRDRQPAPDARIPDHQDALVDADKGDKPRKGMCKLLRPCYYARLHEMSTFDLQKGLKALSVDSVLLLTWWNGQIRTLGPEAYAMTWEVLKKKMTDKYYSQGEIKKLEIEIWNLKFIANETEKVDKYISGLPDNIYRNVKSARPKTLDETIELANDLMDQKLRTYAERQSDNKRKADDSSRNNHSHQQQPYKRQNVAKVYNMGTGERKPYGGSLPKCTKSTSNTNVANTYKGIGATPKGNGCFECGAPGHFKRDCPKLKNKDGGNGNA
ncbi:putative reverse transcriptase domain-containing protein [Tanacetum coccineum]